MKVTTADFVVSAPDEKSWPSEGLPEAAFAGRSNVGKSSLLNKLANRTKLARVSGTPGRTRLINFFRINGTVMLADLPGYGYAKASDKERASWQRMVETYLEHRRELKAVVLLIDIRRKAEQEEIDLIAFLTGRGVPILIAATKADKLGKTKRVKPLRETAAALGLPVDRIVPFSSLSGEGREDLWKRLNALLRS